MLYNHNQLNKQNEKKTLRKVKKQWIVVSLASFAFIGSMYGLTTNFSVQADQTQPATELSNQKPQNDNNQNNPSSESTNPTSSSNSAPAASTESSQPTNSGATNDSHKDEPKVTPQVVTNNDGSNPAPTTPAKSGNDQDKDQLLNQEIQQLLHSNDQSDSKNDHEQTNSNQETNQVLSTKIGNGNSSEQTSEKSGQNGNSNWKYDNNSKTVTYTPNDGSNLIHLEKAIGDSIDKADKNDNSDKNLVTLPTDGVPADVEHIVFKSQVKLPQNSTSLFYGLTNLQDIQGLDNADASQVTSMSFMFKNDNNLKSLDLSKWNVSNADYMSNMFENDENLTSLDLSGWNTSKVISTSYMFAGTKNLTTLAGINNFKTDSLKDMSGMFQDVGLKTLDLSSWNTNNSVNRISWMFNGAKELQSIGSLKNWDISNVDDLSGMFNDATSLKSLDISNWNTSEVKWFNKAFRNTNSLDSLDISKWSTKGLTTDTNDQFNETFSNAGNHEKFVLTLNKTFYPNAQLGSGYEYIQAVDANHGGTIDNPKGDQYTPENLQNKYSAGGSPIVETYVMQTLEGIKKAAKDAVTTQADRTRTKITNDPYLTQTEKDAQINAVNTDESNANNDITNYTSNKTFIEAKKAIEKLRDDAIKEIEEAYHPGVAPSSNGSDANSSASTAEPGSSQASNGSSAASSAESANSNANSSAAGNSAANESSASASHSNSSAASNGSSSAAAPSSASNSSATSGLPTATSAANGKITGAADNSGVQVDATIATNTNNKNNSNKKTSHELPQTGESKGSILASIGLALVSLFAMIGLRKQNHHEN